MTCIILAAGYATRMYPLTLNFPKPLLEVGGKKIIDWLLDDIQSAGVERTMVISNHKFYNQFKEGADTKTNVAVLDDGSTDNDNRLGAVKDIEFAIDKENIDDDLIILAGDNVLDFSFKGFIDYAKEWIDNKIDKLQEELLMLNNED